MASKLVAILKWVLWEFVGTRSIVEKIIPPPDSGTGIRRPSTFFLWIVGVYAVLFGLASQIYENRNAIVENRINILTSQLGTTDDDIRRHVLRRIPLLQTKAVPVKPSILSPASVFCSLFCGNVPNPGHVDTLKQLLFSLKANLRGAHLQGVDLRGTNLMRADLRGADLTDADLTDANLIGLRGLTCEQLKSASHWQNAHRDDELACGSSRSTLAIWLADVIELAPEATRRPYLAYEQELKSFMDDAIRE
jgi:hypothetical protein